MKTKSLGRIFLSQIFVFLFTTLILTCFIGLFCISSAEPPPKKESISADTNASAASDKTDITIVWVLSGGFAFCVIAGGISMIVVRANEKKKRPFSQR